MDETEKMTALKKAYAEIILNTAKEAAARIMASERKTQQYHLDLNSTKEEALRLLLRQKQTMDVKLNEVEMKSLNQQRRIEELEAQLQEAEDIVSNLRVELNEAQMKLEERENHRMEIASNVTKKAYFDEGIIEPENGLSEAVSDTQTNSLIKQTNDHYVANNPLEELDYSRDPVVPSILMRNKKPELYRNGCTQRIRAYKGNLISGPFSLSGESDDYKIEKAGEGICMTFVGADATLSTGQKQFFNKEVKNVDKSSSKPQTLKSFRKRRNTRATRWAINDSTLESTPLLAKETLIYFPSSQACLPTSHDMHQASDNKDTGTHSDSPSIVPPGDTKMEVLSEHVETTRGDTEVRNAVSEDTDVASTLVLIKQKRDSGNCLDVSSSEQNLEMMKPFYNKKVKNVDKSSDKPQALESFRKKRKRTARCRSIIDSPLSDLPNSQTCLPSSRDVHETSNNEDKDMHLHSHSVVLSAISKMEVLSENVATARGDETDPCNVLVNEDTDVASSLVLIKQQSVSENCLDVPSSKEVHETKNSSSVSFNSTLLEAGVGFPSPPPKDRVLKYTFQRKRKKESLSSDDISLHQENPLKENMAKKQNVDPEPPKPSIVTESSRDSRRMAQVARQLISLSEKKWWK